MRTTFERSVLLAAAFTVVATVTLAATAWRAAEVAPPDPEAFNLTPADPLPVDQALASVPMEAVSLIARNEPFREDREPAPEAYRMPGDFIPEEVEFEAPPPPPPPPSFSVLGTVTTAEGGMAVIQVAPGEPAQFVNVDETVQGFRLMAVSSNGAVLARGDQVVNLAVADPSMISAQQAPARRGNTNNNNANNNQRRTEQQREQAAREAAQTERLRALVEQARQSGGAIQGTFNLPVPGGGQAQITIGQDGSVIAEDVTVSPDGERRVRVNIAAPRVRQGQ